MTITRQVEVPNRAPRSVEIGMLVLTTLVGASAGWLGTRISDDLIDADRRHDTVRQDPFPRSCVGLNVLHEACVTQLRVMELNPTIEAATVRIRAVRSHRDDDVIGVGASQDLIQWNVCLEAVSLL